MTTRPFVGGPRPGRHGQGLSVMLLLLCALGLLAQGASPAQAATAEVTAASGLAAATAADTADIGNSSALANLSACLAEK